MGFPIRKSPGQSLFNGSPKLFAAGHVLRRLPAPRHPPYALNNLTIKFSQDKKCRYSIVKDQTFIDHSLIKRSFIRFPRPGEIVRYGLRWEKIGGADRNRTGDLRRAKPALSRLSYSPSPNHFGSNFLAEILVGLSGFEPLTSRLSGVRSNQLSYRPNAAFVPLVRACAPAPQPTPTQRK